MILRTSFYTLLGNLSFIVPKVNTLLPKISSTFSTSLILIFPLPFCLHYSLQHIYIHPTAFFVKSNPCSIGSAGFIHIKRSQSKPYYGTSPFNTYNYTEMPARGLHFLLKYSTFCQIAIPENYFLIFAGKSFFPKPAPDTLHILLPVYTFSG